MRLAADVNELLYAQADIWFSGDGDPEQEIREALTRIADLYREHGVADPRDRRGLDLRGGHRDVLARAARALRRGHRAAHRGRAGRQRASRPPVRRRSP